MSRLSELDTFMFRVCATATALAGNLRTSDFGGPYNISLLSTQYNEIKGMSVHCDFMLFFLTLHMGLLVWHVLLFAAAAGIAAKQNYSDMDIVHFLTNVECLEGQFDTWGTFGYAVYLSCLCYVCRSTC